jgi:hypothetical protein
MRCDIYLLTLAMYNILTLFLSEAFLLCVLVAIFIFLLSVVCLVRIMSSSTSAPSSAPSSSHHQKVSVALQSLSPTNSSTPPSSTPSSITSYTREQLLRQIPLNKFQLPSGMHSCSACSHDIDVDML